MVLCEGAAGTYTQGFYVHVNTHIGFLHVTLWRTVKHVYSPFETHVYTRWRREGGG